MPLACFDANRKLSTHHPTCRRHVPTLWRYRFEKFYTTSYQEIILSLGFFAVKRRAVFILLAMPPTSTEGGVRGVGWLIQASACNQTCRSTNDRCEALASLKGCFLCFCFSPPSIYPLTDKNFVFLQRKMLFSTKRRRKSEK